MENTEKNEQNQAYKVGAHETSDVPIVFVDPDLLDNEDLPAAGRELTRQLEGQVPGITEALLDKIRDGRNERNDITNAQASPHELAYLLSKSGPATISGIIVDGKEYCLINEPHDKFDNKDEIIMSLSRHQLEGKFIPGDDNVLNKLMGKHEGEHCNRKEGDAPPRSVAEAVEVLNEELRADRSALEHSDADDALAYKDLRHLSSGFFLKNWRDGLHDTGHATGVLLGGEGHATERHLEVSSSYKQIIDHFVEGDESAAEVLRNNPEEYFEIVNDGLLDHVTDAYVKYLGDPSLRNMDAVISAQAVVDYAESYEGAYRRRVMGQDVPDKEPIQYIDDAFEERYKKLQGDQPKEDEFYCSATGTVTSEGGLNIRYNPGTEFDKLVVDQDGKPSVLNFGDKLTIHGEASGKLGEVWKIAVTENGRQGYVNMEHVDIDMDSKVCKKLNVPIQAPF